MASACSWKKNDIKHRQFNITSGTIHAVPDIIKTSARIAGVEVEVKLGPGLAMPRSPSLDSSRLRQEIGWEPQYDLEAGITEYAQWMKEQGF